MTREEIDERLRVAAEIRVKLRRATRELMAFGEAVLATRLEQRDAGSR